MSKVLPGLTAESAMDSVPVIVDDRSTLGEVSKLLGRINVNCVLVVDDENHICGIYTEKDLSYAYQEQIPRDVAIAQIMTRNVITVEPRKPLVACADIMSEKNIRHLPVCKGRRIKGILDIIDVQSALREDLATKIKELSRAQKNLNRRDEYLGIVTHDIRNPLAIIKSCCDMAQLSETPIPTEIQDLFDRVEKNTERALNLVNDILDLGRLNSGLKLDWSKTEIGPYLQKIVTDMEYFAADKEVRFELTAAPDLKAEIDRDRFSEVLTNLLHNSIKFSPPDGTIFIQAGAKDRKLHVSVRDQGPGIPQEDIKRLFGRYSQLESDQKSKGFGLGLSIAMQFTKLHNGEITVDGGLGKGATFTVSVPLKHRDSELNA